MGIIKRTVKHKYCHEVRAIVNNLLLCIASMLELCLCCGNYCAETIIAIRRIRGQNLTYSDFSSRTKLCTMKDQMDSSYTLHQYDLLQTTHPTRPTRPHYYYFSSNLKFYSGLLPVLARGRQLD